MLVCYPYPSTPVPGCGYRGPGTEGWCFPFGFHQALEPKPGNWGGSQVPVHHDPVLCARDRAWGHGELGPPHPCRMEAGAGSDDPTMTEHGIYVPGHPFAIFIQVSNRGRNGCKVCTRVHKYIPMKYTVQLVQYSTVQYNSIQARVVLKTGVLAIFPRIFAFFAL